MVDRIVAASPGPDVLDVGCGTGIAARQFQRSFVLAEGIEVTGAWIDNGLLHVDLKRPPAETRIKTVEIKTAAKPAGGRRSIDLTLDGK